MFFIIKKYIIYVKNVNKTKNKERGKMDLKQIIKSIMFKTILCFVVSYFFIFYKDYKDLTQILKSFLIIFVVFAVSELLYSLYDKHKPKKRK